MISETETAAKPIKCNMTGVDLAQTDKLSGMPTEMMSRKVPYPSSG